MENELFSMEELKQAYDLLIQKGKRKYKVPLAFLGCHGAFSPSNISLLPIGSDGASTKNVEANRELFFNEIYRLVNQTIAGNPDMPRLQFKKYLVSEKEGKSGKTRKIVKLCLRDQVIVRAVLTKLNALKIVDDLHQPNPKTDELAGSIFRDINSRKQPFTIIRTDIKSFYHSVDCQKLLEELELSHGDIIGPRLFNIIRKSLVDNKSAGDYTGLPVGMSLSVLLGEFYISRMHLPGRFEGVSLYRYVDDIILLVDDGISAEKVLRELDYLLKEFSLQRSEDKTFVISGESAFSFIGINISNRGLVVDEEKIKTWRKWVQDDINAEFRNFHLARIKEPGFQSPSNKEIVARVWREHVEGKRSGLYPHLQKIKKINEGNAT
jgi:hypothetical protein